MQTKVVRTLKINADIPRIVHVLASNVSRLNMPLGLRVT